MTDMGMVDSLTSNAADINDRGQIVANGTFNAFLWDKGIATSLDALPGISWKRAASINNKGQIVGSSITPSSEMHAVLWQP